MASRFVYGWLVGGDELLALVGSGKSVDQVLEASPADRTQEVFLTLGEGDEEQGEQEARETLAEILAGDLEREHGYRYARVTELLLSQGGTEVGGPEIELALTYYMPGESWGRWNQALDYLGVSTLASVWGVENMTFPWGPEGKPAPWPTWTVLEADTLATIDEELGGVTEAQVKALPQELVAERSDWVDETTTELWTGLQLLHEWIRLARREGKRLFLKMDGDQ